MSGQIDGPLNGLKRQNMLTCYPAPSGFGLNERMLERETE